MKLKKCKHKWIPFFTKGKINNKTIKYIGCYCQKCRLGYQESFDLIEEFQDLEYDSYNEQYFHEE